MSFGYRISEDTASGAAMYAIREFYFDDANEGAIEAWTEDAFTPTFVSREEVKAFLEEQLIKAQREGSVRMGDLNYEYFVEDIEWMQKGAGLESILITGLFPNTEPASQTSFPC